MAKTKANPDDKKNGKRLQCRNVGCFRSYSDRSQGQGMRKIVYSH